MEDINTHIKILFILEWNQAVGMIVFANSNFPYIALRPVSYTHLTLPTSDLV